MMDTKLLIHILFFSLKGSSLKLFFSGDSSDPKSKKKKKKVELEKAWWEKRLIP